MEPSPAPKCVMIIAGEASGDQHGARLVRAMRSRDPNLFFCGMGGRSMAAAGVRLVVDAAALSVVGITEVFVKLPQIFKGMATVRKVLNGLRPDLLILIDFPDFNLPVAAGAKKLGIPVLYYIGPQLWAWRSGRVKKIRQRVDHLAVILPFEADFYKGHHIPATFVGHPLLDNGRTVRSEATEPGNPLMIGLLPGSRDTEVARHLPVMLAAADRMSRRNKNVRFLVSHAPSVQRKFMETLMAAHRGGANCELATGTVQSIFERCGLVVVVSGTASLETAMAGVPMVIIYRVSRLSYWLGRALIRVRHIGLINLIAGRDIAPELIQDEASPEKIAQKVLDLLADRDGRETMRKELLAAAEKLGGPGASDRVADVAMAMLDKL